MGRDTRNSRGQRQGVKQSPFQNNRGGGGGGGGNRGGGRGGGRGSRGDRHQGGGSNRGNNNNRNNNNNNNKKQNYKGKNNQLQGESDFKLMVTGQKSGCDLDHLERFLRTKSSADLHVSEAYSDDSGKKAFFIVDDKLEALALLKLNGLRYFNEKLSVKPVKNTTSHTIPPELTDFFTRYVDSHYERATRQLNLHGVVHQSIGSIRIDLNNVAVVKGLCIVLKQMAPDVSTIILSGNEIKRLAGFQALSSHLRHIRGISLENNKIQDFRELDHLRDLKHLRDLVLTGNPICAKGDSANYRSEVGQRFPTLRFLDLQPIPPVISFDLPEHITSTSIPDLKENFFQDASCRDHAQAFLNKYFELFDSRRDALLGAYSEQSLLSVSCSSKGKQQRTQGNNTDRKQSGGKDEFEDYLHFSRNLVHIKRLDTRVDTLATGHVQILHVLLSLPKTKHQLESVKIDAFLATGVLCVCVHGQFWELDRKVNRSFDRVLLLKPVAPGSKAAAEGWNLQVINEQFHIRPYTNYTASGSRSAQLHSPVGSRVAVTSAVGAPPPAFATVAGQSLSALGSDAQGLVDKLKMVTDLREQYAIQLLQENQWNYSSAVAAFYRLRGNNKIPPEAFRTV